MTLPFYTPDESSLPSYRSSVSLQAELDCKLEWVSPTKRSFSRRWFKAHLDLNNTQLTISPLNFHAGSTKVLSMQYAEIGFAGDYRKGSYPLRLRAEGMQYLFECHELFIALQWFQAIELSIGISLPLELRDEPKAQYKKAHRIRRSFDETVQREKDLSDREPIGSSDVSLCSTSSETERSKSENDDALIVLEDIPKNMTFRLSDFGMLFNRQDWSVPFEMTY